MIKTTAICISITVLGLMARVSRADDTGSTNKLQPTSRETNSSSRIYSTGSTNATSTEVDNTGRNVRDRSGATLTPEDQGNNKSDLETTKRIRRAMNQNDQLSTEAKNIKIITTNGKVTLRGPVKTAQEQQTIVAIAKQIAGDSSVDNQLEIKTLNQ